MLIYAAYVTHTCGEGNPRPNGVCAMAFQELLDVRDDDIVAPFAVMENALAVVEFAVPVDTYRDTNVVLGKKFNDFFAEQGCVGRQAEFNLLANLRGSAFSVRNRAAHHRKIEQRLAAKESNVNVRPAAGFLKEHLDRGLRDIGMHVLLLARSLRDAVITVLIAVSTGEIALIGNI